MASKYKYKYKSYNKLYNLTPVMDEKSTKYKKCLSCIYRSRPECMWSCDYISFKGYSRGCDPGNKCTKYEKGNRLKMKFINDLDENI